MPPWARSSRAAKASTPSWLGRRVFGFQPHATAFRSPVAALLAVPDGLPPERAALLANMETAVNLVLDGAPLLGENVLVIGQGIVGLLVTALLARFPLGALGAVEGRPLRAKAARAFGARIVSGGGTTAADAPSADELFGARGADLVYELSGNPAALDLAVAAAGHEGRIVVGSWYGNKRASVDLGGRFHRRRLRLVSSQVSHIGAPLSARWDRARRFGEAWRALAAIDTAPPGQPSLRARSRRRRLRPARSRPGNGVTGAARVLGTLMTRGAR